MSTTPGVFSETTLQAVRLKMTDMMLDTRVKQQYIPKADDLKALAAITTAKMRQLDNREKDYDVEVEWVNVCGPTVEAFQSCDFGGDKASTNVQKYNLNFDKQFNFSIEESDFTDNDFNFDEVLAKMLLRADKELMEAFAQYFITILNTNKGVNQNGTGIGTVCGSDTYIPPVNWTANLFSYFLMTAQLNRFSQPVMIDGGLLYQQYLQAKFAAGSDNGIFANNAFNGMPVWFDLFNPLATNGDILTDYIIETGALTWANKVYHNPIVPEIKQDGLIKFSQPTQFSDILPLQYDVAMKPDCTTNNLTKYDYNVRLKADILVNPAGCDADNTGILTMLCGTCPNP